MDQTPDRIVRRDFPRSADGYDPAAVDAHLEAIAAFLGRRQTGGPGPHAEIVAAGRTLLGQISLLRVDLKNASASLREQGVAISETLDELLQIDEVPDEVPDEPPVVPADQGPAVPAAVLEDARLVALDLALGGSGREEIEDELAARFDLPDRAALVDEVLAAIG